METLQNQQNNPSVIRTVRLPLTSHLKLLGLVTVKKGSFCSLLPKIRC